MGMEREWKRKGKGDEGRGMELRRFREENGEEEWKGLKMEREWKEAMERKGKGEEWNLGEGNASFALGEIDAHAPVDLCIQLTQISVIWA